MYIPYKKEHKLKKTALYLTIAQDIIDQIQAGSLRPGDQLPVEKELCDKYNVSRMTVNKALSSLVYQNYITRTPGKGSFVNEQEPVVRKNIRQEGHNSFSADITPIGKQPGAILQEYRMIHASEYPRMQEKLHLDPNDMVHYIFRIRTIDGVRVALSHTYIPCALLPALDITVLEHSLYQYLDQVCGIHPHVTEYAFSALLPTKKQQELLQTESCALLKSAHTSSAECGPYFEYTETFYAGNRYTYYFNLDSTNPG